MKRRVFEFVSPEAEAKFLQSVYGPSPKGAQVSKAKAAMLAARRSLNQSNSVQPSNNSVRLNNQ